MVTPRSIGAGRTCARALRRGRPSTARDGRPVDSPPHEADITSPPRTPTAPCSSHTRSASHATFPRTDARGSVSRPSTPSVHASSGCVPLSPEQVRQALGAASQRASAAGGGKSTGTAPVPSEVVAAALGLEVASKSPRAVNASEFPVVSSVTSGGVAARAGVVEGSSIMEVK